MKGLRLHIARVITLIVALQVINLGLFAQDFQPLASTSINPELNIINSVEEYVAEVILHHKNAVPENNIHPQKDLQAHKNTHFKLISFPKSQTIFATQSEYFNKLTSLMVGYDYLFSRSIYPPPPKA